ncbi:methionine adenosyltransferase [Aurantimicrobium photophilum]|jgi:S-adenosylmethionine synthetase|uniref:S-adenosylmethionine synthase n=1 Tax=Aurantimicrobium photophilum TaxID=1987356 RepID=A0A2Z3RY24_9MICO|nr:methionine adenosyltransferase [Aurantimicrobium photophilum]AWR21420.1 S-adenosylmethionine synthase [Aurantimicrobium photophilum]
MSALRLFTSESVTEGHPDKICDQISDSILDNLLDQDKGSRVAVETLVTTGLVHVAGEVTTEGYAEIPEIVRNVVKDIGYTSSDIGFDGDSCGVSVSIGQQSPDIANLVFGQEEQGAGDQGIMFGYATTETAQLMPLPIYLSHRIAERLTEARKSGQLAYLRPDGKTQVTVGYEGIIPRTIETVVVSTQHAPQADESLESLRADVIDHIIRPVLADAGFSSADTNFMVNPMGKFEIGGPKGDAGLTGRKIIVDTYGGASRHGGGAFSGKDPSKVDRSAAYAMRHVAKNAVAAGFAEKLEVQIAYAIGVAQPVGLYVETFGTGKVDDSVIIKAIRDTFDLSPAGIIRELDLLRPIYRQTAAYGHFGRELPDFTWEKLDKVDELRRLAGL